MSKQLNGPGGVNTPDDRLDGSACIELGGHLLQLMPQRAVWWPAAQTAFVADVHIGKATAFRQLGVPVPSGTTDDTLQRLQALIETTGAARLVVLGDLLHSMHVHHSESIASLREWRQANSSLEILLVRGNHDDRSGDPPAALNIQCADPPVSLDGLYGLHEPDTAFMRPSLAGHVHPAVRLQGRGRDSVRLPCFVLQRQQLLLPAFGAFTGMHTMTPGVEERFYVVAGERVIAMP